MATGDNQTEGGITAHNQPGEPKKKEPGSERAAEFLHNQEEAPTAKAAPLQRAENAPKSVLDKKYPAPAELKRDNPTPASLPSKVSLKDIALPEYMKGVALKKKEGLSQDPRLSQSAREIGLGPERHIPPHRKNIVSVLPEYRTEIDENGLPKIRTYANDMSREMKRRGATLTTIVGEERERLAKQKIAGEKVSVAPKRNIILIAGALILIGVGVASVAAALILTKKDALPAPAVKLIHTNAEEFVMLGEGAVLSESLANARADASISLGEIEDFVIVRNGALLSPEEILTLLGAPSALARNATAIMVGVHAFDRNQPFIVIVTSFYDLSFQAMLSWEKTIAETLGGFFKPVNVPAVLPPPAFSDTIFKNVDVRKSDAAWPILYTFPSKEILIITTNKNTLNEILTRLSASSAR